MTYTGGGNLDQGCATISDDKNGPLSGAGTIYGSGCWANTTSYYMCAAAYSNPTYWAWVAQSDGGANHTLHGRATTNGCGGASRVASLIESEKEIGQTTSDISRQPARLSVEGETLYKTEGSETVCVGKEFDGFAAGLACAVKADGFDEEGLLGVTSSPEGIVLWGLAPAGTDKLSVKVGDKWIAAEVGADEAVHVKLAAEPSALAWSTESGAQIRTVPAR